MFTSSGSWPCKVRNTTTLATRPRTATTSIDTGKDRLRRKQPLDRFEHDEGDQGELGERVDEAGQHLDAPVTVGAARVGEARREPGAEEGQQQRQRVDQHVPGIRQQRQRSRPQAADRLRDQHHGGQYEGEQQLALVPALGVIVHVSMGMDVRMGVVV